MTQIFVQLLAYCLYLGLVTSCDHKKVNTSEPIASELSSPIQSNLTMEEKDTFGLAYIMGKFTPETHPDFTEIATTYADRPGLYLRKEALSDFVKMYKSATKDGITLQIKSATRNFDYQKGIWERKWTGQRALEDGVKLNETKLTNKEKALRILAYSSMPGSSRHHWGTDIDLNSFENDWFEKGEGKKIYDWLQANAMTYGYVQVYTPKGPLRPNGYNEERWHWSYKPLSSLLIAEAKQKLQNKDITGFLGAETAEEIDILNNYILGINQACF